MPVAIIYGASALLLIAVAPLPYGFYVLLRLVATCVFAWAAYVAVQRRQSILPWVYGLLALVFNPFVKVFFPKDLWMVVDLAAAALLIFSRNAIRSEV
ncbi:hypothetical protein D9X30_4853 [Cupriavidus sp. U2]|uniref:DUF6804 family protein n=1 Tax=Cupriavidus sp. U2 TaxID=2920269 RepID=UPI00129DCC58|nr:DUF6804 family protein [Cupriavidus sp. U2]KAI3590245.1 hypothetical protein D9X30_4853 [Cupriavidus sp. U2]